MDSRVSTHITRTTSMLLIVASIQLSGCNSSSENQVSSIDAQPAIGSAALVAAEIPATASVAPSTPDPAPVPDPIEAPVAVPEPTPSSPAYNLVSRSGEIYDAIHLNPQNLSYSSGSAGSGGRPELEGADMDLLAINSTASTQTAHAAQESVIGLDNRVPVNAQTYPYRATARITYNSLSHCTGWLVSSDTVVTAGHCVHGGGTTGRWGNTSSFRIFPGFSDGYAPYGSCTARELYSSYGWVTQGNSDADIGIIKLNCTVGNTTGYLSYFVADPVDNAYITVNGYPGDKANGTQQWGSDGFVTFATANKLYYENDTNGGMSGAPLWVYGSDGSIWTIGLHTNGENSFSIGKNSGTRISQEIFDLITAVKNIP